MKNPIFAFAFALFALMGLSACDPDPDFTPVLNNANYDCPDTVWEQDRYVPVTWDQAPTFIRNFVNDNYQGITPALVIREESDPNDYEVYLRAQNFWISLEFEDGRLEQNGAVGSYLEELPQAILDCINSNWPGATIQLFYAEADGDIDVYILYQGFVYELDFERSSGGNNQGNPTDSSGTTACNFEQSDQYQPLEINNLSNSIREYLNANFPGQNPALILRELDDNDTEIYLLENQRWRSLEFEGNNLVRNQIEGDFVAQIPDWITNCVQQSFPGATIELIYRDEDGDFDVYILYQGFIYELDFDHHSSGGNPGNPSGPSNPGLCAIEQEGQYQPLEINNLSNSIREYLNANFPGQNPALILRELDDNDTEIYLLENQRWRSLEFEGNNLVRNQIEGDFVAQIPDWITNCVQQSFPGATIELIYRENDGDYTIYVRTGSIIREITLEV